MFLRDPTDPLSPGQSSLQRPPGATSALRSRFLAEGRRCKSMTKVERWRMPSDLVARNLLMIKTA